MTFLIILTFITCAVTVHYGYGFFKGIVDEGSAAALYFLLLTTTASIFLLYSCYNPTLYFAMAKSGAESDIAEKQKNLETLQNQYNKLYNDKKGEKNK